jgi:LmbE family N-acetylglucosaminyl deacetylase
MKPFYNTIYLSPHLDDVALSCGGQIFVDTAVGQSSLIVTIMAGDPPGTEHSAYVASLHARWELSADATAARRQEDVAACRILGADQWHWDVPDCIYRHHPLTSEPFYVSDADIFGQVDPAERELVDHLAARLADLPVCERLVVPLTVGHHVDHQLVRQAAERLGSAHRLYYYEDFPYARDEAAVQALAADLQAEIIPLPETAVAARIEAVAAFRSQLSTFFNGRDDLAAQMTAYVQKVGGERLWYRLTTPI